MPTYQDFSPATRLTLVFAVALVLGLTLKLWLATRQVRHVARHRAQVPAPFADRIALAAHQKAADYTIAKVRLGMLELALDSAVVLGWSLLGGLDALNQALLAIPGSDRAGMLQQLTLLAGFAAISALIDLPLTLYRVFVLEERFGFNKMTLRLWLVDALKGLLLAVLIGLPVAALILWLMATAGPLWWLWAWGCWMGLNLLLMVLYPTLIAPLFNQFRPLQDPALQAGVGALMQRCGFAAKGLLVMDGSRRSAHANAYFTGFGAARRVVFFDTLLRQLTPGEVLAVLAHELGHFKRRHIARRLLLMSALSLAGFALLGWLSGQMWFYLGLGVRPNVSFEPALAAMPNDALALLLFVLVLPVFTFFITPLLAQLSRRDEFQADAYAVARTSGADLYSALLKLYVDGASTLTPDPVYAKFHYSHPPASERLARIPVPTSG